VFRRAQIGMIVGTVIGGLIVISTIIVITVILCRQRALAEKKTVERVAQIIGATEVNLPCACTESLCRLMPFFLVRVL